MDRLADDVLVVVLYESFKPVPWPWALDANAVCRQWHELCTAHRRRNWYVTHSSIGRTAASSWAWRSRRSHEQGQ